MYAIIYIYTQNFHPSIIYLDPALGAWNFEPPNSVSDPN